jgi:hypothetical protein
MKPYQDNATAAAQEIQRLSQPTPPAPPAPHARLLAMVQGLSVGLGAAGKALATHGREGGVDDVLAYEKQKQEMAQSAQQAAQSKINQQIEQQKVVYSTNLALANNAHLMATLPLDLSRSEVALAGEKQQQGITSADFAAAHGGMDYDTFQKVLSGTTPNSANAGTAPQFFVASANQQLAAATRVLGANDPYVQNLHAVLATPTATAGDLWRATNQVSTQLGQQEKATDAQIKKDSAFANSTVGKLSTPTALADPGAQAAIQAAIADPRTDAADIPTLRALLPQAAVAQLNAANLKMREARNQQVITQGDPDQAGQLLANRSLTLSELKARQVTPKFIQDAVLAAQKYDPNFKAAEADAQAKNAAAPSNTQFFGNTDSLLVKGGTLDQLQQAYKNLGNTKIPAINTIENLRKAAVGSGPLATVYAAQLAVADDGSKILSGGVGSDSAREQFLKLINADLSPAGQAATLAQIRQGVESTRNGRIGTNPYLKDMFPDPTTRQETAGQAGTQPAQAAQSKAANYSRPSGVSSGAVLMSVPGDPTPRWIEPVNQKAAKNLGATEVK